ncbi:AmmeMemoRadiSam system protein A [Bacilliculturomica massiliensis]|uniref:AmmeMemoRadiSam system protein A n=1 Tax=Bacilliculturomica massiliensis TaxID=1917867 RepID=UPI001030045C|nr:AmmeMemoRadiSam system protein A [Bacilliculturomica massiliensis]
MAVSGAVIFPHPPIIMPEIGRGEEEKIGKTAEACRKAARRAAEWEPETVVILSPHSTLYADYFHISPGRRARGDMGAFRAGSVRFDEEYDEEFAELLGQTACEAGIYAGGQGERDPSLDHGTMIPLRFLREAGITSRIVRVGLSGMAPLVHYRFGKCIAQTAERLSRRIVVAASGDLSHRLKEDGPYGFDPEGPEFDARVTRAMAEGDFLALLSFPESLCQAAGECGLRSFQIMAGALDGVPVRSELLSYEGTFGVGYGVAVFTPDLSQRSVRSRQFDRIYEEGERKRLADLREEEDPYVSLARKSLEYRVRTGAKLTWEKICGGQDGNAELPEELFRERAGAFVSLKKDGVLRGCIGTIGPVRRNLAEEIAENAVSAGIEDPRFDPVEEEELEWLVYSVDVLGEPEPVDSPAQLDPQRYGVIVENRGKRGLLLPCLDGVDTVEKQLSIAKRKAGIREGEQVTIQRFEVVRHR